MSDDGVIREKLEMLRKYMYEELNKLKNHILEEKNYECGLRLMSNPGCTVRQDGDTKAVDSLLKHKKAHRRADMRYRKYGI